MIDKRQEMARVVEALEALAGIRHDGQAVDQLVHALQTATRVRRGGGDAELVAAALIHDVGKLWHEEWHAALARALLYGRVRPAVLAAVGVHADMRGGRTGARSEEERLLLAADEASVDDASYHHDPLASFLPELAVVMRR